MKTTILLAAIIGAGAISNHAKAADLWRMYQCTGDQGEAVFTDRKIGTECREIWITPRGRDESGWFVTDPSVGKAETAQ